MPRGTARGGRIAVKWSLERNTIPETDLYRSPGYHVSELLHEAAVGLGILPVTSSAAHTKMASGSCFEIGLRKRLVDDLTEKLFTVEDTDALSQRLYACEECGKYAPGLFEPGEETSVDGVFYTICGKCKEYTPHNLFESGKEMEVDGIFFTPDLITLDYSQVHEIKLTWKKLTEDPSDLWLYCQQLCAYAYGMKVVFGHTPTGYLHVCFVNNDYAHREDAGFRSWKIDFSDSDLESTWRMIQSIRDKKVKEGEGG